MVNFNRVVALLFASLAPLTAHAADPVALAPCPYTTTINGNTITLQNGETYASLSLQTNRLTVARPSAMANSIISTTSDPLPAIGGGIIHTQYTVGLNQHLSEEVTIEAYAEPVNGAIGAFFKTTGGSILVAASMTDPSFSICTYLPGYVGAVRPELVPNIFREATPGFIEAAYVRLTTAEAHLVTCTEERALATDSAERARKAWQATFAELQKSDEALQLEQRRKVFLQDIHRESYSALGRIQRVLRTGGDAKSISKIIKVARRRTVQRTKQFTESNL